MRNLLAIGLVCFTSLLVAQRAQAGVVVSNLGSVSYDSAYSQGYANYPENLSDSVAETFLVGSGPASRVTSIVVDLTGYGWLAYDPLNRTAVRLWDGSHSNLLAIYAPAAGQSITGLRNNISFVSSTEVDLIPGKQYWVNVVGAFDQYPESTGTSMFCYQAWCGGGSYNVTGTGTIPMLWDGVNSGNWSQAPYDYGRLPFLFTVNGEQTVPEPASFALVGLSIAGMAAARRRKTKAN